MKLVLFGATGMLGSGALIECLAHRDVTEVLTVGRRASGMRHPKLTDLVQEDLFDLSAAVGALTGVDGCLYCLGVSSAGMTEEAYRRVTRDLTLSAAAALLEASPGLSFCFISGAGTDSSERGRIMWARVKGETENRLLALPVGGVWIFRPGYVQPLKGVRSRFRLYNAAHALVGPLHPLLSRFVPSSVTTTESLGLALIRVARDGSSQTVLGNREINALAAAERRGLG